LEIKLDSAFPRRDRLHRVWGGFSPHGYGALLRNEALAASLATLLGTLAAIALVAKRNLLPRG
jgi:hypothetical protein